MISKWSKSFLFRFSILSGLHLCFHHHHLMPRFPLSRWSWCVVSSSPSVLPGHNICITLSRCRKFQKFISPPDVFVVLMRWVRSQHISFDFEIISKSAMFTNTWFDVVTINFARFPLTGSPARIHQGTDGLMNSHGSKWSFPTNAGVLSSVMTLGAQCTSRPPRESQHLQPDA